MELVALIVAFLGLVSLITGAVFTARSTTTKETIKQQKDLIGVLSEGKDEQKDQIADLNSKAAESATLMANMQGQIDTLKTVPLQQIASDVKDIKQTQHDILSIIANKSVTPTT